MSLCGKEGEKNPLFSLLTMNNKRISFFLGIKYIQSVLLI